MIAERKASDDALLMDEVGAGSVAAFAQLYDRYCHRAYRIAFLVCRDDGRAQDAVQEAFLSVWKSRTSYLLQQGTVATWLLTIVRHRAIDVARKNERHDARRTSDECLEHHAEADDFTERTIRRDEADRLRTSLALLPHLQQEVIALAFYGQLSHTEIAAQLDLPTGTVKGRMRLGLQKLRADIGVVGAPPSPILHRFTGAALGTRPPPGQPGQPGRAVAS